MHRVRYPWEKDGETCRFCLGSGAGLGGKCKHCLGSGKTFKGEAREACEACAGTGQKEGSPCGDCEGKGWHRAVDKPRKACAFCMSSGKVVGGGSCRHCGGSGYLDVGKDGKVIDLTEKPGAVKETACPYCLGLGYKLNGPQCEYCKGTGKVIPPKPPSSSAPPAASPPPPVPSAPR